METKLGLGFRVEGVCLTICIVYMLYKYVNSFLVYMSDWPKVPKRRKTFTNSGFPILTRSRQELLRNEGIWVEHVCLQREGSKEEGSEPET